MMPTFCVLQEAPAATNCTTWWMPAKESESPMPNLSRADVLTFKMAPSAQGGSGSVCSCTLHMHSGDFRHPQIFQWIAVSINGRCEENPNAVETCSCPAAGWAELCSEGCSRLRLSALECCNAWQNQASSRASTGVPRVPNGTGWCLLGTLAA